MLTLTYAGTDSLFSDLRLTASLNATQNRRRGLTGRQGWQESLAYLSTLSRDGRLPATMEIVYGHAWKDRPRNTADGRAIVQFDPARRGRP